MRFVLQLFLNLDTRSFQRLLREARRVNGIKIGAAVCTEHVPERGPQETHKVVTVA